MRKKITISRVWNFIGILAALMLLTSCQQDKRMLKKFVSRFNAEEYNASSAYIYPSDQSQLAFFTNEVREKSPNSFLKVKESTFDEGKNSLIVTFQWENPTEVIYNYFNDIGRPLSPDGELIDTIPVRHTVDGDRLAFTLGLPGRDNSQLRMVQIKGDNIKSLNIYKRPGGKVIRTLENGKSILTDKSSARGKYYWVYWVTDNGNVASGFVKKAQLNVTDTPYFHIGILDSMGLIVALIVMIVLVVPILLARALFITPYTAIVGVAIILGCLYLCYECIEKILFELFIINLPY